MSEYAELKKRLARGWNTWNTRSVLSHVLLPEGFALNLGIKSGQKGTHLKHAFIGLKDPNMAQVRPGPRSWDGGHTCLEVAWQGVEIDVGSATVANEFSGEEDLVLLVTPKETKPRPALLIVEAGMLWNRPGRVAITGGVVEAALGARTVRAWSTRPGVSDPYAWSLTPYLALPLDGPVGLSTGKRRSLKEITDIVKKSRAELQSRSAQYGDLAEVYDALRTCMAWDTVYEPLKDRVVSPVSRNWSAWAWGGYVLFCWDTYFAACLAAVDNPDLAFANAIEITREKTPSGFVPNFAAPRDNSSFDRSQPPVGSMMVREVYRRHPQKWFLQEVFDGLLEWNRWWERARDIDGYLAWGSNPVPETIENDRGRDDVDCRLGAALESGLDNSPMYDDIPFRKERHVLELADAGLMGLYLGDCDALAEIADALGRAEEAAEVRRRADKYSAKLQDLWDDEFGLYLNRRTDTGEFSRRISPTNFYPMLGRTPTQEQAERMVGDHLRNPGEFWGEWIMPSISRSDAAYGDNQYWRGRIWAPMNFLVYLGLRNYRLPEARRDLAERSKALLLKEWREHGHVHENYNAETGVGDDVNSSDRFYHWGALLGLIALMEAGRF